MQVSEHLHAVQIPFVVPVAPGQDLPRLAYAYLALADTVTLIDCGVQGAEQRIYDYLGGQGKSPETIATLLLTHSHPDHLGAAKAMVARTGCQVWAHGHEQGWIEDTDRQYKERPVPGFHSLVGGPVTVNRLLTEGEWLTLATGLTCQVLLTPGHSRGSTSFWFKEEGVLLTGDALPVPGDLPIYENISAALASVETLQKIPGVTTLLSSWEAPIQGAAAIAARIAASHAWLARIHATVLEFGQGRTLDPMVLCALVVERLGLPPVAVMPLVAKGFASSLAIGN